MADCCRLPLTVILLLVASISNVFSLTGLSDTACEFDHKCKLNCHAPSPSDEVEWWYWTNPTHPDDSQLLYPSKHGNGTTEPKLFDIQVNKKTGDYNLVIKNATKELAAYYECKLVNKHTKATAEVLLVSDMQCPTSEVHGSNGTAVSLECSVEYTSFFGQPNAALIWKDHNGMNVTTEWMQEDGYMRATMNLTLGERYNGKVFTCALDTDGFDPSQMQPHNCTTTFYVPVKPFLTGPVNTACELGSKCQLNCTSRFRVNDSLEWYIWRDPMKPFDKVLVYSSKDGNVTKIPKLYDIQLIEESGEFNLILKNITQIVVLWYQCALAKEGLQKVVQIIKIESLKCEQPKPFIVEKPMHVTCSVHYVEESEKSIDGSYRKMVPQLHWVDDKGKLVPATSVHQHGLISATTKVPMELRYDGETLHCLLNTTATDQSQIRQNCTTVVHLKVVDPICTSNPCTGPRNTRYPCLRFPNNTTKCFCEGSFSGERCETELTGKDACRKSEAWVKEKSGHKARCECVKRLNGDLCGTDTVGCFADRAPHRDLPQKIDGKFTASECLYICEEKNFFYGGTQFGNECWCGNNPGAYGQRPSDRCNVPCDSNTNMNCGGYLANRVMTAVYGPGCFLNFKESPGLPFMLQESVESLSWSKAAKLCEAKGFKYAAITEKTVRCGDYYNVYDRLSMHSCSYLCNEQQHCGKAPNISTVLSAYRVDDCYSDPCSRMGICRNAISGFVCECEPEPGEKYCSIDVIGCFKDQENDRDLPIEILDGKYTASECIYQCQESGYLYAGSQLGDECWCGNKYGKYGPSDRCTVKCEHNPSMICGGPSSNTVMYALYVVGCFKDKADDRDLPVEAAFPKLATEKYFRQTTCVNRCKALGYRFAGLQETRCFCGNSYNKHDQVGDDVNHCNFTCPGQKPDREEKCGGKLWNTVVVAIHSAINPCPAFTNPCQNGGTCATTPVGYKCICLPNFTGKNCETVVVHQIPK